MKRVVFLLVAVAAVVGVVAFRMPASGLASGPAGEKADPASSIKIPPGYRDWKLISVAHEAGVPSDIRALLGNEIAIKAYRENRLPFPDGAIIARLAWSYVPSEENDKVFGRDQSFVAGAATNVQFMIKDSRKYAATGGWGFAQFTGGKPVNEAAAGACFSCHEPAKAHDFVFTQYAP
jgi:hypothetical protein